MSPPEAIMRLGGCGEGHRLSVRHDALWCRTEFQHGDNPEHIYRFDDYSCAISPEGHMERHAVRWLRRLHAYEARA